MQRSGEPLDLAKARSDSHQRTRATGPAQSPDGTGLFANESDLFTKDLLRNFILVYVPSAFDCPQCITCYVSKNVRVNRNKKSINKIFR